MSGYRSGTYAAQALARIEVADQAREVAEAAAGLVPTGADRHSRDGEFVADAVRLLELARRLVDTAVLYERVKGTGWDRIAADLGDLAGPAVLEAHAAVERDYRLRFLQAWLWPERAGEVLTTPDRVAGALDRLDAWAAGKGEDGGDRPVSGALAAMGEGERSALLDQAEALLDGGGLDDAARRDLEIAVCRRRIELYEDMETRTPGALAELADARTRLRALLAADADGRPLPAGEDDDQRGCH